MSDDWLTRETLLERAKNQDDQLAWEEFVSYYKEFIIVVLRKISAKPTHHEDIVQEILLKIWKGLPKFEYNSDRSRFRTWLNTVIRNTTITYYNKHKNHDQKVSSIHTEEGDIPIWSDDEIDKIIEREWKAHICNLAMDRVKPLFSSRALKIFDDFVSGVNIKKISQEYEIKENSVYKMKNRVQLRVKAEIQRLIRELEPGC
ncbi:MAG: sigma-70 family RNA polymerase sigma factor [Planctomycetes bacterium]|nr:sigma-70 family RNA polymerase sigma factor [Planctomycetota bacterium]